MFTGIVTDVGEVLAVEERARGLRRVGIGCSYDPGTILVGASIACAGICLTVVEAGQEGQRTWFTVEVAAETLAVTTASRWRRGSRLNLERALKIGDELGGHLVSGHVDGLADLATRDDFPGMARLRFQVAEPLTRFVAPKGSIALDGVSLTVNEVEGNTFGVLIIPHTLEVTTLNVNRPGDQVNIEVDLMARYAARLLETC
jgi:riboflavin synthase